MTSSPETPEAGPEIAITADEKALAVVDRDCQIAANLPGTYEMLYRAEEQELLDSPEGSALLLTWREISQVATTNAERLLREAGNALP